LNNNLKDNALSRIKEILMTRRISNMKFRSSRDYQVKILSKFEKEFHKLVVLERQMVQNPSKIGTSIKTMLLKLLEQLRAIARQHLFDEDIKDSLLNLNNFILTYAGVRHDKASDLVL
jgi:hypothetical protein